MANATTKSGSAGEKKERKAPVRKGPQAKDYPSRVAYLEAVLQYEKAEQAKVNEAKVARLDKRIASKADALAKLSAEIDNLKAERQALVGTEAEGTAEREPAATDGEG